MGASGTAAGGKGKRARAARRKRRRKALLLSGLRKLFAASAMSTVVRTIIGQGQVAGDHFTDRLTARARRGIETGLRRIVLYLVAGVLFAVAGGFLIAAGFMGLTLVVAPPLAALIVAVVLALAGGATLLFDRMNHGGAATEDMSATSATAAPAAPAEDSAEPKTEETPAAEAPPLALLLTGLLDSFLKYAGRNLGLITAVLFLIALWFGLGGEDREAEEEEAEREAEEEEERVRAAAAAAARAAEAAFRASASGA